MHQRFIALSLTTVASLLFSVSVQSALLPGFNGKATFTLTILPEQSREIIQADLQQAIKKQRRQLDSADITLAVNKLARRESELIKKLLRAEGFYAAAISYDIDGEIIHYSVKSGPVVRIKTAAIGDNPANINLPPIENLGLLTGDRLRADAVLLAKKKLEEHLEHHNCLWQTTVTYEVKMDRVLSEADIVFHLPVAEHVRFGLVSIDGTDDTTRRFIRGKLSFAVGDCYRSSQLESSRLELLQLGLFSLVDVVPSPPVDGKTDIHIEVKERLQRTITTGLGYSTDEGIGVSAGWQHRNVFGGAKTLGVDAKYSSLLAAIESALTIPAFLQARQKLTISADLSRENLEAFDAVGLTGSAIITRKFKHALSASAGFEAKVKDIDENDDSETFALLALPLAANIDRRNDILNPESGWISTVELRPVVDVRDVDTRFLKLTLAGSVYHTLSMLKYSPTFALRAKLGGIYGLSTPDIPADERFYAGGGGSVRGYPFQELGPIVDNDPVGGRSLLELSLEARLRFSRNWGGVVFMDGGNVYDQIVPQFDKTIRWAVGVGARYYTALAPLRVDIAFPLQRRSDIDDAFQIYISLAQAF